MLRKDTEEASTKQGFALIVALSLTAFMLVLLLSMALLLRVEAQSSATKIANLRAKEAARFALMMALGDLQKHAGPDQRVTARAMILGNGRTVQNPYWTGVWDSTNPAALPHWLVSWQDQSRNPKASTMRLVGPQTVGYAADQYVDAPVIQVFGDEGTLEAEIAWWVGDEGVKASAGTLPLNLREAPNFLPAPSVDALHLQLAGSHGLEELFGAYDRFSHEQEALALERIHSIEQMVSIGAFADDTNTNFSGEAPFHILTPASYGVLASTHSETDAGLMRDLSLFPQLLGSGIEEYLRLGEEHAASQSLKGGGKDGLRLIKPIQGLSSLPALNDGDIFTPVAPILSNFIIAFTIRSQSPVSSNPNFYLRMRFFCEFWNPFTHSLSMRDIEGEDLELELEINGLPEVTVTKTTGVISSSPPIDIQNLLADPSNSNNSLVIRLAYNQSKRWLPGQSKNWTGVDASTSDGPSPYTSMLDDSKDWNNPAHTLGGSTGLDTGIPRLSGNIRHTSKGADKIDIRVYLVNPDSGTRNLISEYTGFEYEPVSTRPSGYSSTHSGATFGYHILLRGPHYSSRDKEYYRGRWIKDHDPRNPKPIIQADWHLDNDPVEITGSPYTPVKDGIIPLALPLPAEINETNNTINTVVFRRPLDRSSGSRGNYYDTLWQDTPLFELPRERVLSLASLQHLYIHNERPFQVGNSWGAAGKNNELKWFDRYYFSGFSRSDESLDYDEAFGPPNPTLIAFGFENPQTLIAGWQAKDANDKNASRLPAKHLMVRNRFNLNSTSVAAWKSVLGSLRLSNFNYLDYPEDDTSSLNTLRVSNASREGSFARFSQSLEETYEAPATPAFEDREPVAPSAFYRHGARRFDRGQLEKFAGEIVRLLKARGRPYNSMEEFLSVKDVGLSGEGDESLLEEAIRNIFGTGPNGRQQWYHQWETSGVPKDESSERPTEIDHFSPGFLTQADVMTAIGPMLSPRSDTFKIRASGRSLSKEGQVESTARIEATVQRITKPINPDADPAGPNARQFKILDFRWIRENDI